MRAAGRDARAVGRDAGRDGRDAGRDGRDAGRDAGRDVGRAAVLCGWFYAVAYNKSL